MAAPIVCRLRGAYDHPEPANDQRSSTLTTATLPRHEWLQSIRDQNHGARFPSLLRWKDVAQLDEIRGAVLRWHTVIHPVGQRAYRGRIESIEVSECFIEIHLTDYEFQTETNGPWRGSGRSKKLTLVRSMVSSAAKAELEGLTFEEKWPGILLRYRIEPVLD